MGAVFDAKKNVLTSISQKFSGCPGMGCFCQNFHKISQNFFCLRGPNAGAIILKKFGFLNLPWKFRQNPLSRSRDIACFKQGVLSKISTFYLRRHISHVFQMSKSILTELKIGYLSYLHPLVGCCRPNGSGVTAVQSCIRNQKCTPRPIFQKNHSGDHFFFAPSQESHPDTSF